MYPLIQNFAKFRSKYTLKANRTKSFFCYCVALYPNGAALTISIQFMLLFKIELSKDVCMIFFKQKSLTWISIDVVHSHKFLKLKNSQNQIIFELKDDVLMWEKDG